MGLFKDEPETFSPIKESDNDDDSEEASDYGALESLWSAVKEEEEGKLIANFDLFCHLYDASFKELTSEESGEDVNGFAVIENIFTPSPLQIKPELLERAQVALAHAAKENEQRPHDRPVTGAAAQVGAPGPGVDDEGGPAGEGQELRTTADGVATPEPTAPAIVGEAPRSHTPPPADLVDHGASSSTKPSPPVLESPPPSPRPWGMIIGGSIVTVSVLFLMKNPDALQSILGQFGFSLSPSPHPSV